jgi:hypothetical protein
MPPSKPFFKRGIVEVGDRQRHAGKVVVSSADSDDRHPGRQTGFDSGP